MPQVNTVTAVLRANAKQFTAAMETAKKSAAKLVTHLDALKMQAGVTFAAMGLASKKVVDAARTQIEAETKLAAAIKATGQTINADTIKAYASALQEVTTVGDEVTIGAAATLASFQLTERQIKQLIPGIQDFAAATGRSMDTVTELIGRLVANGQADVSRYGIALSDVEKKTLKFGDANERAALTASLLQSRFGGAARALAKTDFGQIDQAMNAFGDAMEEIGKGAAKALAPIATAVKEASVWFTKLSPQVKDAIGKALVFGTAITGIVTAAAGLAYVGKTVWGIRTALLATSAAALKLVAPLLLIPTLIGQAKQLGQIVTDPGGFARGLRERQGVGEGAGVGELASAAIKDAFQQGVAPLRDAMATVSKELIGDSGEVSTGFSALNTSAQSASQGLKSVAVEAMDFGGEAIGGATVALSDLADVINRELNGEIMDFGGGLANSEYIFRGLNDQLDTAIKTLPDLDFSGLASKMKAQTSGVADVVQTALDSAGPVGNIVQGAVMGGPVGAITAAIMEFVNASEPLQKAFGILTQLFQLIVNAFDPLFEALGPVFQVIVILTKAVLQPLEKLLGVLGETLQSILVPLIPLINILIAINPSLLYLKVVVSALTPIIEVVGRVMEKVGRVMVDVFNGVAKVWNSIVHALAEFIRMIEENLRWIPKSGGWRGRMRQFANEFETNTSMEEMTYDDVNKSISDVNKDLQNELEKIEISDTSPLSDSLGALVPDLERMGKGVREVTSSLTNVPQVLKISKLRYDAIQANDMIDATGVPGASSSSGSGDWVGGGNGNTITGLVDAIHELISHPTVAINNPTSVQGDVFVTAEDADTLNDLGNKFNSSAQTPVDQQAAAAVAGYDDGAGKKVQQRLSGLGWAGGF